MKKGFTLAELLGVIVIISIIAIIAVPPIINQIKKSQSKIDEATMTLIEEATNQYVDYNKNVYPITNGVTYCITLQQLVDANKLKTNIINGQTGEEIPLTKIVKMVITSKIDIDYTLVDACS